MDLSNKKNMRTRFDFEFPKPMTLDNWRNLLDMIEAETFWIGADQQYEIQKIHGDVLIYTESRENTIDIVVYTIVDLGERL